MSYLEEMLPEFRNGARIRISTWPKNQLKDAMVSGVTDEGRCLWHCSLENFLAKYKFLFKSKFKLNDLFEVQNDPVL